MMAYPSETMVHLPTFHSNMPYDNYTQPSSEYYQGLYPTLNVPFSNSLARQSSLTPSGYTFNNPFTYDGQNHDNSNTSTLQVQPPIHASFAPNQSSSLDEDAHRSASTLPQGSNVGVHVQQGSFAPSQPPPTYPAIPPFDPNAWTAATFQPHNFKELDMGQAAADAAAGQRFLQLLETKLNLDQSLAQSNQTSNPYPFPPQPSAIGTMTGSFGTAPGLAASVPTSQPMSTLPTGQSHTSLPSYPSDPRGLDTVLQDYSQVTLQPDAVSAVSRSQSQPGMVGPYAGLEGGNLPAQFRSSTAPGNGGGPFFPTPQGHALESNQQNFNLSDISPPSFAPSSSDFSAAPQYSIPSANPGQQSSHEAFSMTSPTLQFPIPRPLENASISRQTASSRLNALIPNFTDPSAIRAGPINQSPVRPSPARMSTISRAGTPGRLSAPSSIRKSPVIAAETNNGGGKSSQSRLSALSPSVTGRLTGHPIAPSHDLAGSSKLAADTAQHFQSSGPAPSPLHPPTSNMARHELPTAVPALPASSSTMGGDQRVTKKRKTQQTSKPELHPPPPPPSVPSPSNSFSGSNSLMMSNDGGTTAWESNPPQAEEKKPIIACHLCRSKKLKCDGVRPRCGTCTKKGEESCEYDAVLRRRGPGKNNKKDSIKWKQNLPHLPGVDDPGGDGAGPGGGLTTSTAIGGWQGEMRPLWGNDDLGQGQNVRFELSTSRVD